MFGHDNHDDNDQKTDDAVVSPVTSTAQPSDTSNLPTAATSSIGSLSSSDTSNISLPSAKPDPAPSTAPTTDEAKENHDEALLTTNASDDLISIKQDALKQLSPLVGHLDQSPEEKFRTTMMMIQASDDQSLIKSAYEAAKQIPDDKARAQALLDIVNEINYFTQQSES